MRAFLATSVLAFLSNAPAQAEIASWYGTEAEADRVGGVEFVALEVLKR